MIQEMWSASSAPRRFFTLLEPRDARILKAFTVAFFSYLFYALTLALAFIRSSGSNAYLPLFALALGVGAAQLLFFWGLGGVSLQRPGSLDVRAWEVAGWSWTPAFFVGVSMLPALLVVPTLGFVLSATFLLVWHLAVLRSGLQVFLERAVWRVVAVYALLVIALPLGLFLGIQVVFSRLT